MQVKNVVAGLMFTVFSIIFLTNTNGLTIGTASDIGPAFFPTAIAICLFVVGIIITFKKTDD